MILWILLSICVSAILGTFYVGAVHPAIVKLVDAVLDFKATHSKGNE